jgi:hypothetical protein
MLILPAVCSLTGEALGGRNAGGSLVVHAEYGTVYSANIDFCEEGYRDPGRCVDANTQVDVGPGEAAIVWLLAAFPAGSSPAVTVVQFGLQHTVGSASIVDHDYCGPVGFTIPNAGFPESGTAIAVTYYPTVYRTLFPVYWFAIEGGSGDTFASSADPAIGQAVFVDESSPPQADEVEGFGMARWGSPGDNDCPLSIERREASLGEIKAGFR